MIPMIVTLTLLVIIFLSHKGSNYIDFIKHVKPKTDAIMHMYTHYVYVDWKNL